MRKIIPGTIKDNIDMTKIYQSNNCGNYRIIENLGYIDYYGSIRYCVKIEFIGTGYQKIIRFDSINRGNIYDPLYCLNLGKTFYSIYYGPYTILSDEGGERPDRMVKIRFLNTGYECIVRSTSANNASVSDKTVKKSDIKSTYGTFDYNEYHRQIIELLKSKWHGMMNRCYNIHHFEYYRYGAQGVTVAPIWQYLEGFLKTIENVEQYNAFYRNPAHYQLDKDYKQRNIPKSQRIYSPYTCTFLTEFENSVMARLDNHDYSKCFGITDLGNNLYRAELSICGHRIKLGTFDDLNAAITIYEICHAIYSKEYNSDPSHYDINLSNIFNRTLPKDYKEMSYDEAMTHKLY